MLISDPLGIYRPATFTFAALNTPNGSALIYKSSTSEESLRVPFPGLSISSTDVCGEGREQCRMFVSQSEGVVLVVFPAEGSFAMVTFENRTDSNQLVHRQNHVISAGTECRRLTLISESASRSQQGFLALVGLCQTLDQTSVFLVLASINLTNLRDSNLPFTILQPCQVTDTLASIYFESDVFSEGVLVVADRAGEVRVQQSDGACLVIEQTVCSNIERLVQISPTLQAIYCREQTDILDINSDIALPVLLTSEFGLPFFCESGDVFVSYANNTLTLRQRTPQDSLPLVVDFPYGDDVMAGECVPLHDEFFAVVQLANGTVIAVNMNKSVEVVRGFSVVPPRVFQQSILLTTANSTVVHSLLNTTFRDEIDKRPLLVAVTNNVGRTISPTTISSPPMTTTTMETLSDSTIGAIAGGVVGGFTVILIVLAIILIVCCGIW